MRLWIVMGAIGAAVLILVIAQSVTRSDRTEPLGQISVTSNATPPLTTGRTVPSARAHVAEATRGEEGESAIDQNLKAIESVMSQTSERTLPLLCEKLASPETRVRHSALTNLVVLADRDALPALTEALNRTADSEEKAEIQKAIDFLQLPTYDELVANGTLPRPNKAVMTSNRLEAEKTRIGTNAVIQKVEN